LTINHGACADPRECSTRAALQRDSSPLSLPRDPSGRIGVEEGGLVTRREGLSTRDAGVGMERGGTEGKRAVHVNVYACMWERAGRERERERERERGGARERRREIEEKMRDACIGRKERSGTSRGNIIR